MSAYAPAERPAPARPPALDTGALLAAAEADRAVAAAAVERLGVELDAARSALAELEAEDAQATRKGRRDPDADGLIAAAVRRVERTSAARRDAQAAAKEALDARRVALTGAGRVATARARLSALEAAEALLDAAALALEVRGVHKRHAAAAAAVFAAAPRVAGESEAMARPPTLATARALDALGDAVGRDRTTVRAHARVLRAVLDGYIAADDPSPR